ncbi:hypothetical protein YC2023_096665 [Brassica napus]
MTLEKLMEYGNMLVMEQENVKRVQLADQYLNEAALGENVKRVQLHCVTCVADLQLPSKMQKINTYLVSIMKLSKLMSSINPKSGDVVGMHLIQKEEKHHRHHII